MADGFELLKAYIALAVQDGDMAKVKGQINSIKSALGGIRASGNAASQSILAVVGEKGFGGKQDIAYFKKAQKEIDDTNKKLEKASKLLKQISARDVSTSVKKSLNKANAELKVVGIKGFGDELSELKKAQASIDRIKKESDRQLSRASKSLTVLNPADVAKDVAAGIRKANAQLSVVGEKGFGGKADIGIAKKIQAETDKSKKEFDKLSAKADATFQRMEDRAKAAAERTRQQIRRLTGNIFLETGFLFPGLQGAGNIFRAGEAIESLGEKMGLAASATKLLSGAFRVLLVGGLALQKIAQIGTQIATAFGRQIFSTIVAGFRAIIAPITLAAQALQRFVAYLPLIAVGGLIALGEAASQVAAEFQKLQRNFRFAFAGDSTAQLQFVRDTAQALGLDLQQLAAGYSRLAISARFAGVPLEDVRSLFLGISDAAAVLGLNADDLGGIFKALDQILSKGKVTAEELRGQLGERLAGAFGLAARSLGIAQEQLDQYLRSGAIKSREFVSALGAELRRTFGPDAAAAADELPAKLNRLQNSLLDLKILISESGFAEAFVDLKQAIVDLVAQGPLKQLFVDAFAQANKFLVFVRKSLPVILPIMQSIAETVRPIVDGFLRLQVVVNTIVIAAFKELISISGDFSGTLSGITSRVKFLGDEFSRLSGIDFSDFRTVLAFVQSAIEQSAVSLDIVKRVSTELFEGLFRAIGVLVSRLPEAVFRIGFVAGVEFTKGLIQGFASRNPKDIFASNADFLIQALRDSFDAATSSLAGNQEVSGLFDQLRSRADELKNSAKEAGEEIRKQFNSNVAELGANIDLSFDDTEIKNLRATFLDAEGLFKSLQGGDAQVTELRKQTGKLDEIKQEIQRGNAIRQTTSTVDARFRGALA